jgi:hypothetical protein
MPVCPSAQPSPNFFFSNDGAKLSRVARVPMFSASLTLKLRVGSSSVSEGTDPSTISSSLFSAREGCPQCPVPHFPAGNPGYSLHEVKSESLPIEPIRCPLDFKKQLCLVPGSFTLVLFSGFTRRLFPNVSLLGAPLANLFLV